jgi:hypothetical protein
MTTQEMLAEYWKIEDIPACDEGMELARLFLESCARAVEVVSFADTLTLRADFHFRFSKYAAHRADCEKCNEV